MYQYNFIFFQPKIRIQQLENIFYQSILVIE